LASVAARSIPHLAALITTDSRSNAQASQAMPERVGLNRRARSAQSAEDGERVLGQRLVDELATRLGLAVEPLRELVRLVFRRCSDEHVGVAAKDALALLPA